MHNPTVVTDSYDPRKIQIPKKLIHVHKFHPQFSELENILNKKRLNVMPKRGTRRDKLLKKQNGLC
jgi:hypothetical protein